VALVTLGVAGGMVGILVGSPHAASSVRPLAYCTTAQKAKRQAALRAYKRAMLVQRRADFRSPRGHKAPATFVRRQKARLQQLTRLANCPLPPTGSTGTQGNTGSSSSSQPTNSGSTASTSGTISTGTTTTGPTTTTTTASTTTTTGTTATGTT